jgi:peroxiredoxin
MGADGKLTKISTAELFPADGTTVMFGVPGAFTPG